MVHPRQTTWTAAYTIDATDWLRWDNWSEGIPWSCTDVLIPGDMKNYPVLKAEAAAERLLDSRLQPMQLHSVCSGS